MDGRKTEAARHVKQPAAAIEAVSEHSSESNPRYAVRAAFACELRKRRRDAVRVAITRVAEEFREVLRVAQTQVETLRSGRM